MFNYNFNQDQTLFKRDSHLYLLFFLCTLQILFVAVVALAFLMICLKGFEGPWPRYMFRFVLLFSYIIPISLRVNMDMAKSFYAYTIQQDETIAGTVARFVLCVALK